jgi:hypothetical protein
MIKGSYEKQPFDVETIEIDWSARINALGVSGYAISAVDVKIYDSAGIDKSADLLEGTGSYSGVYVYFTVKAGTAAQDYAARIRVTLTKAEYTTLYQEEDLSIRVRQKGFA